MLLVLAACTPPVRQFDIKDQPISCEQANRFAHDALKSMGYTITAFTPAAAGGTGLVKGTIDERGRSGSATVIITCGGAGPAIDASEDGKWLGQIDFKRGFSLTFTGLISQQQALDQAAKQQASLPVKQRKQQGLEVLLTPLRGLEAKMDFPVDWSGAGVLPVRVVINNRTGRRYQLDPQDIVMVRANGDRVPPLSVSDVTARVAQATPANSEQPAVDLSSLPQQVQAKLFTATQMPADASASGYLFYPLDAYTRGRVLVTEAASEETEGFVVEF